MPLFDRKLLVGVETELGLVSSESFDYFSAADVRLPSMQFLDNGMRLYRDGTADCRDRLEAASAEAPDPLTAVLCLRGALRRTRSYLPKDVDLILNNVDSVGNSWGTHENYLCKAAAFDQMERLAPHLASRIIFTGAGFKGPGRSFLFSGRIEHINELKSYSTVSGDSSRGMLNTRRESHVGDAFDLERLHIILGESNISDQSNFLKLGTTAIVLKLLEDGLLPDVELNPKRCVDFAHELNLMAGSLLRSSVKLPSSVTRAISVQRAYLNTAIEHYSDNSAPWLTTLFDLWGSTLYALETDPLSLLGTIDWVTKHWVMTKLRTGDYTPQQAFWTAELQYSDPRSELHAWLAEMQIPRPLFSEDAVERAAYRPPRKTRAWGRGGCIRELQDSSEEISINSVNWGSLAIQFRENCSTLLFDDPLDSGEVQLAAVRSIKQSVRRSR